MKKLVAVTIAVTLGLASTSAMAGIKDTKHDLSVGSANMVGGGSTIAGGSNQICIYCHTPHNAVPAIPLWNRTAASNTGYSFYSSPSMKLHQGAKSAFESTSTSLQCMSCHNGVDGLGAGIVNKGGEPAAALTGHNGTSNINGDVIAAGNAKLGKDLSNDHPVNIQMINGTAGLNSTSASNQIKGSGATALTTALPLFKGSAGDNYIECGSCHSVHDNSHSKFLRTSNKGSVLCLACHAK
jgi:predicted CXXCH cytochrome family protein